MQGLAAVAGQHTQTAARVVFINVGDAVAVQVAPRFLGVKSPAAPANQALSLGGKGEREEGALGAWGISQGAVSLYKQIARNWRCVARLVLGAGCVV